MTIHETVFLIFLSWGLLELIYTYTIYRSRRTFQVSALKDRCRRKFAILRMDLFKLAVKDGKIDPKSVAFQWVYIQLSYLVRRPFDFRVLARSWVAASAVKGKGPTRLTDELAKWPDEAKEIIFGIASVMEKEMVLQFAPWWVRIPVGVILRVLKLGVSRRLLGFALEWLKKKNPNQEPVREFRLAVETDLGTFTRDPGLATS